MLTRRDLVGFASLFVALGSVRFAVRRLDNRRQAYRRSNPMDWTHLASAILLGMLIVATWLASIAQANERTQKSQEDAAFIERLIGQMTLEEKADQLT